MSDHTSDSDLDRRAFGGIAFFVTALALLLFVPAWTVRYWEAWAYLATFTLCIIAITLYLARNDRALLARRLGVGAAAEKEASQRVIQFIAQFAFIAVFLVPSLDHRFGWSRVPAWAAALGDVLTVLGLGIVFLVFKENSFTAATIAVGEEQRVVSTGPYALVRHPMYGGALVMLLGTPLALGSWWGLLSFVPMLLVIVWRLVDEERFLAQNLPGYVEYRARVRSRLLPHVF